MSWFTPCLRCQWVVLISLNPGICNLWGLFLIKGATCNIFQLLQQSPTLIFYLRDRCEDFLALDVAFFMLVMADLAVAALQVHCSPVPARRGFIVTSVRVLVRAANPNP